MVKMNIDCERTFKKRIDGDYFVKVAVWYSKEDGFYRCGNKYNFVEHRFSFLASNQLYADSYICKEIIAKAINLQKDSYRNTEFIVHMRDVWIDGIFGRNWLTVWATRDWRNSRNKKIDGYENWNEVFRMLAETGAKFTFVD